ncbi:MAG: transporter [Candidatus Saccharimonas sp.]|nr:transporter [Planctomycetaceae bacterium]
MSPKTPDRAKCHHVESLPHDRQAEKHSASTARSAVFTRSDEGYFGNAKTDGKEGTSSRRLGRGGESPFSGHIETDRDSFTPSTRTVERERCIVESSYSFVDNRDTAETHSFPELLMRYGLTERIELRFGGNYEVGGEGADGSGAGGTEGLEGGGLVRESQLLYGLKLRLTEREQWRPESSVILQGHTPTSGPDPATALSVGCVFGWELPDDWKLDSALRFGADSEGSDRFEEWSPSPMLRKSLNERWNVHTEYFGHFSRSKADDFVHHSFSPGVHYLITPNIEIGVRVGRGLNEQTAHFVSNTGIGWRF